jgi:hypothetical protein
LVQNPSIGLPAQEFAREGFKTMLLDKTIRLFLDGIGRREEYEFYLAKFQSGTSPGFALVCPDADCMEQALDALTFDLQFLLKLELAPVLALAGEAAGCLERLESHPGAFEVWKGDKKAKGSPPNSFIALAAGAGRIPVVVYPGSLSEGLARSVPHIARRVQLVRASGSLRFSNGEPVFHLTTQGDKDPLLHPDDVVIYTLCQDLLQREPGTHVSVTSPIQLLRELFTVKGAGTVVRRGSVIRRISSPDELDREQIIGLLEAGFGKTLANDAFLDAVTDGFVEAAYRGAALLETSTLGAYLSKFAVGVEARGEGLAQELWTRMVTAHARIYWRSRDGNAINHWYKQKADGRQRAGDWLIFWRGIAHQDIPAVIEACCARPSDFSEPGAGRGSSFTPAPT